jgi:hypothetical protein
MLVSVSDLRMPHEQNQLQRKNQFNLWRVAVLPSGLLILDLKSVSSAESALSPRFIVQASLANSVLSVNSVVRTRSISPGPLTDDS